MTNTQDIIFPTLAKLYPKNNTDLHRRTPFQLLIAVMMSAQTTDVQVNKVTEILFQKIHTPHDVIAMGQKKYNQAISSIGLHNSKSKHIYQTSQLLIQLHEQWVHRVTPFFRMSPPDKGDPAKREGVLTDQPTITQLTSLPGVGIKTTKVVLHVLRDAPYIAVDTHVHRVSNRLGFVQTDTPEQTDKILESVIKPEYRYVAHHTLIFFGRYHCTARRPKCWSCPLYEVCCWSEKSKYHW